ncbi:MAG: discoidin domain-containing protein, partial [Planctomycetota bacterium]
RVQGAEDRLIRILLHGLTGPVDERNYTELMVPMGSNNDQWISSVINYVRNTWGNKAGAVSPKSVATIRAVEGSRKTPWTLAELHRFDPKLSNRRQWKVSANRGGGDVRSAIDGKRSTRWATGTPQVPGQWYRIELPEPKRIYSLRLDAASSGLDWPVSYEVRLSDDGKKWGDIVAKGPGNGIVTTILFPPTKTKHIQITQTGVRNGKFWSIHDLQILEAPEAAAASAAPAPEVLPPVAELVKRSGNAAAGRTTFEKLCTTCHRLGDKGTAFGPDLADVGLRLKHEEIYQAILEPSAKIDPKFQGVTLQTRTGSFLSGYVLKEDGKSLTLKQPGGKETNVVKRKILFSTKQEESFMPEDLEKGLGAKGLVDLVEFLKSQRKATK